MNDSVLERGLLAMKQSRDWVLRLADSLPADKVCFAPVPGGNHALWTLGHLAWTDEFFLVELSGEPAELPDGWAGKFGTGSTPVTDAKAYPSYKEVRQIASDVRDRIAQWYEGSLIEEMSAPPPDGLKDLAKDIGQVMFVIATHEAMHSGQLAVVRKALKLPPLVG